MLSYISKNLFIVTVFLILCLGASTAFAQRQLDEDVNEKVRYVFNSAKNDNDVNGPISIKDLLKKGKEEQERKGKNSEDSFAFKPFGFDIKIKSSRPDTGSIATLREKRQRHSQDYRKTSDKEASKRRERITATLDRIKSRSESQTAFQQNSRSSARSSQSNYVSRGTLSPSGSSANQTKVRRTYTPPRSASSAATPRKIFNNY